MPFSPPSNKQPPLTSPVSPKKSKKYFMEKPRKHINHKSEREWSCILWMVNEQRTNETEKDSKRRPNKSTRAINISFRELGWCEPRQRGVKISIKFAEYHLACFFFFRDFYSMLSLAQAQALSEWSRYWIACFFCVQRNIHPKMKMIVLKVICWRNSRLT